MNQSPMTPRPRALLDAPEARRTMMRVGPAARRSLLLVEPNFMLRRTVSLTVRGLDVADVREATSYENASRMMAHMTFDSLLISLDDDAAGIGLIRQVRAGATACGAAIPIAAIANPGGKSDFEALQDLGVTRVLLKPAKVKHILQTIASLAALA